MPRLRVLEKAMRSDFEQAIAIVGERKLAERRPQMAIATQPIHIRPIECDRVTRLS